MKYGDILTEKIKEQKLSLRKAGSLLGYSAVHINDICKSNKAPSLKFAIRAKEVFGFDVTDCDNLDTVISYSVKYR